MVITEKKEFVIGAALAVTFFCTLAVMFSPIFGGGNAFKASDKLFNSIAKGSSYYIPKIVEEAGAFQGETFHVALALKAKDLAQNAGKLLTMAGATSSGSDARLEVSGDLGRVIKASLDDADAMFHNRGKEVGERYGLPEKEVLVAWWTIFKEAAKDLKRQEKFKEAAFLEDVMQKGIEVGYNFYGIAPEKASSKAGILGFALIFYIIYTLWWGYAILYMFHGLGLEMKASKKQEV